MKHYQKPDKSIWAFELDGSQDHLITEGMLPISAADLVALRASQIDPKDAIHAEISALEKTITLRRLRESMITGNTQYIKATDDKITALRATL